MTRLSSPTLTELQIASLDSMDSILIFSKFAQIRITKSQVEVDSIPIKGCCEIVVQDQPAPS